MWDGRDEEARCEVMSLYPVPSSCVSVPTVEFTTTAD